MKDFIFYSIPLLLLAIIFFVALISLRLLRNKKAKRMMSSENFVTGAGATTWDNMQGPSTQEQQDNNKNSNS